MKDGLLLALNVAAMLIAFLAFIALFDAMLGGIKPGLIAARVSRPTPWRWWPDDLRLQTIFGWVFAPVAFLIGVEPGEADEGRQPARDQAGGERARRVPDADEGRRSSPSAARAAVDSCWRCTP